MANPSPKFHRRPFHQSSVWYRGAQLQGFFLPVQFLPVATAWAFQFFVFRDLFDEFQRVFDSSRAANFFTIFRVLQPLSVSLPVLDSFYEFH